ncbi:DUF2470 domain-containing protein [Embleya sp. NBC_00896]|uniref:DUF2470 domain-containing protein n=1 Tax=Embleya sp. NBC_00896 TaxID=2975961 RepID=UPI00386CA82A|nr:DUF2470 domain-containing protein [Embleya sp. NBC_00896]
MSEASVNPFGADAITAVCKHMNDDHPDDCLLIARGLGGQPAADSATMTGLDGDAAYYAAIVAGETVEVRVPWSRSITERRDVRIEVVVQYNEACKALGLTPRGEGEH